MNTVQGGKMKLKRPTLETTKNCITILKELHAIKRGHMKYYPENWRKSQLAVVLTMLTKDERWIEEE